MAGYDEGRVFIDFVCDALWDADKSDGTGYRDHIVGRLWVFIGQQNSLLAVSPYAVSVLVPNMDFAAVIYRYRVGIDVWCG
ncbi:hypothetical protein J8V43_05145 [Photorhabdus laumondii]|uniref:hypothetical protein n=1 Tax=Photorhabdus laumondii TaxID=2218628 RepID=UPI000B0A1035|nr:hypothetical protein [Photorhabdus laumondii]